MIITRYNNDTVNAKATFCTTSRLTSPWLFLGCIKIDPLSKSTVNPAASVIENTYRRRELLTPIGNDIFSCAPVLRLKKCILKRPGSPGIPLTPFLYLSPTNYIRGYSKFVDFFNIPCVVKYQMRKPTVRNLPGLPGTPGVRPFQAAVQIPQSPELSFMTIALQDEYSNLKKKQRTNKSRFRARNPETKT